MASPTPRSLSRTGRIVFVHELGDPASCDGADEVIALTPAAYEACAKSGLEPTVLDDHAPRPDLCFDATEYLRWQLDWLRRLDQRASAGNGAVQACSLLLKVPIDSVVIAALMLRATALACQATEIVYVGWGGSSDHDVFHRGHLQFCPLLGDRPLASRLLGPVAQAVGARYTIHDVARPSATTPTPDARSVTRRARSRLVEWIGPYRRARFGMAQRGRPRTMMTWYSGYGASDFTHSELQSHRGVCYLVRGRADTRIVDPSLIGARRGISVDVSPPRHGGGANPTELPELLTEVDQWTQTPGAAEVLTERLELLVTAVAPTVNAAAQVLAREMAAAAVSCVAAANPSSIEEFAALLAAERSGLDRVLVQHGDHLLPYDFWLITETRAFTDMYVSDTTVPADLASAAERLGVSAPAFHLESPRTTDNRHPRSTRRRGWPTGLGGRPGSIAGRDGTVAYLPGNLLGDSSTIDAGYYDSAWYHRWHLRLLDLMAAHPEIPFIWKALPSADQARDPMPDVLRSRRLPNVTYLTIPFPMVLPRVQRVISDYPSTGLYEAVRSGKPVLSLAFSHFAAIRESAAAAFAPVLRVCQTEDEALEMVGGFLAADPQEWILPPSRFDPVASTNRRNKVAPVTVQTSTDERA